MDYEVKMLRAPENQQVDNKGSSIWRRVDHNDARINDMTGKCMFPFHLGMEEGNPFMPIPHTVGPQVKKRVRAQMQKEHDEAYARTLTGILCSACKPSKTSGRRARGRAMSGEMMMGGDMMVMEAGGRY